MKYVACLIMLILLLGFISTVVADEHKNGFRCGQDEHRCSCVCGEILDQAFGCSGEGDQKECFCKLGTQPEKMDFPNSTYEKYRGQYCGDEITCPCFCGKGVEFSCKKVNEVYTECSCADKNGEEPKSMDVSNSTVVSDKDKFDSYCGTDEHACRCFCGEVLDQAVDCSGEGDQKDCICKYGKQPEKIDVPNSTYEKYRGKMCGDEITCPCICGKGVVFNCNENDDGYNECFCADKNGEESKNMDVSNSTVVADEHKNGFRCGQDEHRCSCVCGKILDQAFGCSGEGDQKECFCKLGTQPEKMDFPNSTYEKYRGKYCGDEITCPCFCGKGVLFNCNENDGGYNKCSCADK